MRPFALEFRVDNAYLISMTKNLASKNQAKANLAKLLATENILVRHKAGARTASFDLKSRVLTLPVWGDISDDLYDMLLIHEVGHALFTDTEAWGEGIKKLAAYMGKKIKWPADSMASVAHDYLNVLEDARIDKLQRRKFPGCKGNYRYGYKELAVEKGFFGPIFKANGFAALKFIDRLNVHFKYGVTSPGAIEVPFSADEKPFVDRAAKLETWEQVYALAVDIFDFEQSRKKSGKKKSKSLSFDDEKGDGSLEKFLDGIKDAFGEKLEEKEDAGDNLDDENADEGPDEDKDKDEDEGPQDVGAVEFENRLEDVETFDKESAIPIEAEGGSSDEGGQGLPDHTDPTVVDEEDDPAEEFGSDLVDQQEKILENMAEVNYIAKPGQTYYIQAPIVERSPEHYVMYAEDTIKVFNYLAGHLDLTKRFQKFKSANDKAVGILAKEFNMRQAADLHKRTSVAKTGLLNMDKLVHYKTRDDIFLRGEKVEEGKSHGLFMVIDWSSSMSDYAKVCLQQVITLVRFCRKVGIPFEVFLFTDGGSVPYNFPKWTERLKKYNTHLYPFSVTQNEQLDGMSKLYGCRLINLISSDLALPLFNKALLNMFTLAINKSVRRSGTFAMGGTPLDSSIMQTEPLLKAFKEKNGLQFTHLVYLTDGAGDVMQIELKNGTYATSDDTVYMVDTVTKKTWLRSEPQKAGQYSRNNYGKLLPSTPIVLDLLKSRVPGLTTTNFYLSGLNDKQMKEAKDNKYIICPPLHGGFDNYYIVDPYVFTDFLTSSQADLIGQSLVEIENSFKKNIKTNKVGTIVLREFAKKVAG